VTAKAYVLIQTSVGNAAQVLQALRGSPGIVTVDAVTGPYDIISVIEGKDLDEVGKIVLNYVHGIHGITHTVTCPVITA
jgi:DNA-binding Lrp family transcriptional regulator